MQSASGVACLGIQDPSFGSGFPLRPLPEQPGQVLVTKASLVYQRRPGLQTAAAKAAGIADPPRGWLGAGCSVGHPEVEPKFLPSGSGCQGRYPKLLDLYRQDLRDSSPSPEFSG